MLVIMDRRQVQEHGICCQIPELRSEERRIGFVLKRGHSAFLMRGEKQCTKMKSVLYSSVVNIMRCVEYHHSKCYSKNVTSDLFHRISIVSLNLYFNLVGPFKRRTSILRFIKSLGSFNPRSNFEAKSL